MATSISAVSSYGGAFRSVRCVLKYYNLDTLCRGNELTWQKTKNLCYLRCGCPCQALEPYNWKLFRQRDPNTISGIAVHDLSGGVQNKIDLLFVPNEKDEYRREEQGTWTHELKWQRRALADDPAWYLNRLFVLCALFWLLSLVPGALAALSFAADALTTSLSVAGRWMHGLTLAVRAQARTHSF
ncbi:hypothetical protein BJV74DRAFT_82157 [Russula compacta]|nr:hypothetical protein BJV74DRAFT_82157 [Russula compacta]